MTERKFDDTPAVRRAVPLHLGLVGPSGSGKTYSALRLATGIQSIYGGDIFGIDSEANRMLHYADKFKFRHVPFAAPFDPLSYLAAVEHCVKKGAKTIIIDSASHLHEPMENYPR
jgi:ABC-type oligopeptide transport system ATPase subunit